MKRRFTFASAALLATALFAAPLFAAPALARTNVVVDDAGIDYADTDLTAVHPTLARDGEDLVLALDEGVAPNALPAISFVVPEVEGRTDFFGDAAHASLADIDEVEVAGDEVAVVHEDVALRELAGRYRTSLERLGFTVSTVFHTNANHATLDAVGDGDALRIVLHRMGGDVEAHLFVL